MISEKLKEWKYYYDKFPLYFKNDENIISHFRMIYDLLVDLDDISEESFKFLNIFSEDNFEINENALDMLGYIYGVYRNITFNFELIIEDGEVKPTEGSANITLNDTEFLTLIGAQIIKNNYNGTYEDLNKYYDYLKKMSDKKICIKNSNDTPGRAIVFLIEKPEVISNYYYLLFSGLLVVESAGIEYFYEVSNTMNYLYWDADDWDDARWS